MTKRLLLRLCFVLLPCLLILASCSKKDESSLVLPFVSDLRVEMDVETDRPMTAFFVITTAESDDLKINPNIYRDGKLVAQTQYISPSEEFQSRKATTFAHTGLGMSCGINLTYLEPNYMQASGLAKLKVKLFRNNQLVKEYTQNIVISSGLGSEQINLFWDTK